MRIGVRIENQFTVAQQRQYARDAEECGFGSIWAEGNPFKREPFCVLGLIANECTTPLLGLAVGSVYLMHPVVIASLAATVDEISGGRMRIAVGVSSKHALDALDIPQDKPLARMREAISMTQALLRGGTHSIEGAHYSLKNVGLGATITRKIPVYAAGEAPKMQQTIAELADGLVFPTGGDQYDETTMANVTQGLARGNRERDSFSVIAYERMWLQSPGPTDPDEDALLKRLASRLVYRVSPSARLQMGIDEENAEKWLSEPLQVPDEVVHALITIGDAQSLAERVRHLEEMGVDELVLDFPYVPKVDNDEQYGRFHELMCGFGRKVLPLLATDGRQG